MHTRKRPIEKSNNKKRIASLPFFIFFIICFKSPPPLSAPVSFSVRALSPLSNLIVWHANNNNNADDKTIVTTITKIKSTIIMIIHFRRFAMSFVQYIYNIPDNIRRTWIAISAARSHVQEDLSRRESVSQANDCQTENGEKKDQDRAN